MKYYLGVDGGGTKSEFVLCDETGFILSRAIFPCTNYIQSGFDGITRILKVGIEDCCRRANISISLLHIVGIGLAGYKDVKKDDIQIEIAVKEALGNIPFLLYSDAENAHAGALGGSSGINIVAGTGSIGFGVDEEQHSYLCGGWNHLFGGDEGSGYWLACKMICAFTKQSDGREVRTELYRYLKSKYGIIDDGDIITKTVIERKFDRTLIADMAKDLYELALLNDSEAINIYEKGAEELALIVQAIIRNLNFQGQIKVSYTGGVFKSGEFILKPLRYYLRKINAKVTEPEFSPVIGSILMIMREEGVVVNNEMRKNLKENYNDTSKFSY